MLTVTERAARYFRESLTRKEEGAPEALRIVYTEEGYELTLDDTKDGDQVFEQEGQNYWFVDGEVSVALSDATIDVQESPQGKTLTLTAARSPETEAESEAEPKPQPEAESASASEPEAKPESEPPSPSA